LTTSGQAKPREITERHLLLVEGREEELFFDALARHLGLKHLQTMGLQGKDPLTEKIKAAKATTGFGNVTSLAIIRDADDNAEAAFQSVCTALKGADLPVPAATSRAAGASPTVRVYIVPSHDKPGMLEDLCLEALKDDRALICVDEYFKCLQSKGLSHPKSMSKARIRAFLSSRPDPELRLGEAAGKYIPWDSSAFTQITQFVKAVVA